MTFENFCKALNNLQIIRDTGEPYDILTMTGGVALEVSHSCNEEIALGLMRAVKADYIRMLEELKAELEDNWLRR